MKSEKLVFTQDDIQKFKEKFSKSLDSLSEKEKLLLNEILNQEVDINNYDFSNSVDIKTPIKNKFSFLIKRDFSDTNRNSDTGPVWNWRIWAWKFNRPKKPKTRPVEF